MKTFFTLFVSLLSLAANAQAPEPAMLWLKGYSGNSTVSSLVSGQYDGGFVVLIGANANGGNIDSLCPLSGDRQIFLKYNSDASMLEWTKCYQGSFSDSFFVYIFETPGSGYVLCGGGKGSTHTFLIHKENAAGTVLWSKSYGDGSEIIMEASLPTQDGGYIMAGEFYYTSTDFPVHYGSSSDADIAVVRVDSNGNKVWSRVIGGSSIDDIVAVLPAPGDGCYISGTTLSNDYDFTGNHGGDDGYLVRLDKNGNTVWVRCIGGAGGDEADCAASDGKGGVLIGGASNSLDGDRTHFPSFGCPIWALEVDSNKNITWNNCYGGGGGNCYAKAICKATEKSVWIAGVSTKKGADVDTSYGLDDAWFVHTDDTGNLLNAKVLGSRYDDRGAMVYPLSNGNVIAGGFYDTANGSFLNLPWNGPLGAANDAFLTIFEPWSTSIQQVSINGNSIKIYPNPTNEEVIVTTEQKDNYDVEITDATGKVIFKSVMTDRLRITVRNWPAGLYFVMAVSVSGYRYVQKMIVY